MGFEPTNGGFADQSWIAILLIRLAFTPAHSLRLYFNVFASRSKGLESGEGDDVAPNPVSRGVYHRGWRQLSLSFAY